MAPRPPPPPPRKPAPPRAETARRPWLTLELGGFVAHRELRFQGLALGAAQLREYTAPAAAGPRVRVELFPAAPFTPGSAAGAGLFVSYGRSLGLTTHIDGGDARPSELSRLAIGATWRSPPWSAIRVVVAPSISYQAQSASVRPAVPGLADTRLAGAKAALDLELWSGAPVSLLVGGGYVRWLSAQDLVAGSVPFFPGGSASALELTAGVSLSLARWLSLRLQGEYGSTRYAFDPDPTGVYRATGATDVIWEGRLALRAAW